MGETFRRMRKRALREAGLRSLLLGMAAGLLVLGIFMLLDKLLIVDLHVFYAALVGAVTAAVVGGLCYLLLYRSDAAFARRLDEVYQLGEKVQTAVAFRMENGEMQCLQRMQTEAALRALPRDRKGPVIRVACAALALLLSLSLLVTAVALPSVGDEPAPSTPPTPFAISEWQLGALQLLIEEVRYADVADAVKDPISAELGRLLEALKNTTTRIAMRDEVVAAIVLTDLTVENINSFKKLCVVLDGTESEPLRQIAAAMLTLNGIGFGEKLALLRPLYTGDAAAAELTAMTAALSDALAEQTNTDDALLAALSCFAADMAAAQDAVGTNENTVQALVDKAFAAAADGIGTALSAQYANKSLRDRVITKLIEIFGLTPDEIPPLLGDVLPTLSTDEENGEGDEEDSDHSGGFGKGEELFGSNDTIYHPFGEDGAGYVLYGDVFLEYYSQIEGLLSSDKLTAEVKSMIIEYFNRLSDGTAQN